MRHALLFLWQRTGQRVMVYGHSAGGHLAAAMLATDWHGLYPKTAARLRAGRLFDLRACSISPRWSSVTMNQDLRLDEASAREVSPLFWPAPKGRAFDAVVGGLEFERVPAPERGHRARPGARTGAATRYQEIAGTNHFTVIDALADPDSDMVERLAELAKV